jgi:hypothetical protein
MITYYPDDLGRNEKNYTFLNILLFVSQKKMTEMLYVKKKN